MTGQQIRNYSLVLVVLVVLVLILENPFGSDTATARKVFPGYQAEEVDRVVVENQGSRVELERRGPDDWILAREYPLPADTSFIHRAFEAIGEFEATDQVARNPEKHALFQVDTTGASVQVFAGDETVAAFVLGKNAPSGGTYYRVEGEDVVYQTDRQVKSYFVKSERGWQNRRIFNEDPEEFTRFTIERGDSTIVFEADTDSNWHLRQPEAFPVEKSEMDGLLRGTARLFANAMPDSAVPPEQTGLDEPTVRVRAERLDGTGLELLIGDQTDDGQYYARAGDREWLYLIAKYRVDPYYKELAEMRAEEPEPEPADAGGASDGGGTTEDGGATEGAGETEGSGGEAADGAAAGS